MAHQQMILDNAALGMSRDFCTKFLAVAKGDGALDASVDELGHGLLGLIRLVVNSSTLVAAVPKPATAAPRAAGVAGPTCPASKKDGNVCGRAMKQIMPNGCCYTHRNWINPAMPVAAVVPTVAANLAAAAVVARPAAVVVPRCAAITKKNVACSRSCCMNEDKTYSQFCTQHHKMNIAAVSAQAQQTVQLQALAEASQQQQEQVPSTDFTIEGDEGLAQAQQQAVPAEAEAEAEEEGEVEEEEGEVEEEEGEAEEEGEGEEEEGDGYEA